eukprot:TRINITY_DN75215_c0_g1_i1.p1 TRINITY_DN75215_c0_g1~~TRINITY_DN75215_c0_g1_i1.p1  ORF type:complete len:322 (+),score=42.81 TRINITY_DN75215_c0_g1_i1:72-1037(+)
MPSAEAPSSAVNSAVPIAILHGVWPANAEDLVPEARMLARKLGTYVESIDYGYTVTLPLDKQVQNACAKLQAHRVFGKEKMIDLIGHSNGGIVARAIAQNTERCLPGIRVRHYIAIGSPQNGVTLVPDAPMLSRFVFFTGLHRMRWFHHVASTSAYMYDSREPADDLSKNNAPSMLNTLNCGGFNTLSGDGGILGNVLLVMFDQDEVIRPKESSWFARVVGDSVLGECSPEHRLDLCDTEIWRADTIGLRELWDQDRLFFSRSPQQHDKLQEWEVESVLAPFFAGKSGSGEFEGLHVEYERIGRDMDVRIKLLHPNRREVV